MARLPMLFYLRCRMDKNIMASDLRIEEGEVKSGGKHVAYKDHLGYLTLGIGRLIDARKGGGLTDAEAEYLLRNDIERINAELIKRLPCYLRLSDVRQRAILNMAFQLGVDGVLKFKKMIAALSVGAYAQAEIEALDSKWAKHDTPERARRVAGSLRTDTPLQTLVKNKGL
jgi:lysozyme